MPLTFFLSHDNESLLASAGLGSNVPALGLVDGHTAESTGSCKSGRGVADQVGNIPVRRKHGSRFVSLTEMHPSTSLFCTKERPARSDRTEGEEAAKRA